MVKQVSRTFVAAALALGLTAPVVSAQIVDKTKDAGKRAGAEITDGWITTKLNADFVNEDLLKHSKIDVDTDHRVVTLNGRVASDAGRARAVAIAKGTDGVTRVIDRLSVVVVADTDAWDRTKAAARSAKKDTKDAAHDMKHDAKDAVHEAKHDTKAAAREMKKDTKEAAKDTKDAVKGTAGRAGAEINDGWITTKIKTDFVGEDALKDSNISVNTDYRVVTLTGTVPTQAGRLRAVAIAKQTDGVTHVVDKLTVGPKR